MDPQDFSFISDLVRDRSAIVLGDNKEYLVEARMSSVCLEHGLADVAALVAKLRGQPGGALETHVVEAMTTNETSFFRDVKPFEVLKNDLIPALLKSREVQRRIHIWCAASASGQEPYSIAMALRETFAAELEGWKISILATDLSTRMVERTEKGAFSQIEVNRGLPAPLLVKYFERSGMSWQIREDVRQMIQCRQLNLIQDWPALPTADIVFIRNVLIYFDPEVKTEILRKVRGVLKPDGYLLLGGAETTLNIDPNFERLPDRSLCYQHKEL